MAINILSSEIINQIAAGEVIENPGAVIKELVENSIDANSTKIDVEIENAGLKKIIVKDNGTGIAKEDLFKAPLRHATSKIRNFNDLYSIKSMGFRGEALASIFSVGITKLISKQQEKQAYEISSADQTEPKISGNQDGTTIIVEELFYNTPARKKYLKSESLELKSIVEIMKRFELSYPEISFSLKHNNKLLINKPECTDKEKNIVQVLGSEYKNNLIEVDFEKKGIKVKGYLANPIHINNSYKKDQYIFVNNRFIKSKILTDAIYAGFSSNLMIGRHPAFILHIEIDPEIIDVNVHPTKIEVKFENELEIFEIIKNAISKTFENKILYKDFEDEKKEFDKTLESLTINTTKIQKPKTEKTYYTVETQKELLREESADFQKEFITENQIKNKQEPILKKEIKGPLYEELKDYKIVGQVCKTYIILETPTEMLIVDQHAAEEKINYEKYKEEFLSRKIQTQKLLKPTILQITDEEMLTFKESKKIFKEIGIEAQEFGSKEVMIRSLPICFNNEIFNTNYFKEILNQISINKIKTLQEDTFDKIATKSCRASIKAGEDMTNFEIKNLIEKLKTIKEPFNCPHGRPTILRYTFSDLEKKFKRIV